MGDGKGVMMMSTVLMNIQLYPDGLLYSAHIFLGKNVGAAKEPCLADGRQLVRHSLPFLTLKGYHGFAGINPFRLAGKGDNFTPCVMRDA